jgi:hypothetical protein
LLKVASVSVIFSFDESSEGVAEQPVAMSATAEATAIAAPNFVRREFLTVTPLCAWIGEIL